MVKKNDKKKGKATNKPKAVAVPAQRKAINNAPQRSVVMASSVQRVCAITDPFCKAAMGSKWPDASSQRSLALPFHTRSTHNTNATGGWGMMVIPAYTTITAVGTTVGNVLTMAANTLAGPTLAASTYRIVSFGVKIRNISAVQTCQGMVRIRGFSAQGATALNVVNNASYNCDYYEDIPLFECKEVCVILKRLDNSAEEFVYPSTTQPTANFADWVSNGWGCCMIAVDGGPVSLPVLDLEFFVHYEICFDDADTMSLATTPSAGSNSFLTDVSSHAVKSAGNIFKKGAEMAERLIAAAAYRSAQALMNRMVPGSGTALSIYGRNVD